MLLTPDPLRDNAPLLNAMIRHTALAGGGVVRIGGPVTPIASPVFIGSNVHIDGGWTRFVTAGPAPGVCVVPDVWWTPDTSPGGLAPLCDADGLVLGKAPPVGQQAVLRWDDINAYRTPADGIVSVSCDFRYDGGSGTILGWGGKFVESKPREKLRLWVKSDGTIRLDCRVQDLLHATAAEGPVLTLGWHALQMSLDTATGEITLTVDGVDIPRQYGTPTPFTIHWSDTLFVGAEADEWACAFLNKLPGGRVKNVGVRGTGSWTVAALTDTDGPTMTYKVRFTDAGPPTTTLVAKGLLYVPHDTDPVQNWSLSRCTIENQFGSPALYLTNTQNFEVSQVRMPGCGVGVRMEQNVYDGVLRDLRINANVFGVVAVANGGQAVAVHDSTISLAAGGKCGHVSNAWHGALVDCFVKDIPVGAVGGLFGANSRSGWTRVNCYNEGGFQQFANVVTRGVRPTLTDCTLSRPPETGPVLAVLAGDFPEWSGQLVGDIRNDTGESPD